MINAVIYRLTWINTCNTRTNTQTDRETDFPFSLSCEIFVSLWSVTALVIDANVVQQNGENYERSRSIKFMVQAELDVLKYMLLRSHSTLWLLCGSTAQGLDYTTTSLGQKHIVRPQCGSVLSTPAARVAILCSCTPRLRKIRDLPPLPFPCGG